MPSSTPRPRWSSRCTIRSDPRPMESEKARREPRLFYWVLAKKLSGSNGSWDRRLNGEHHENGTTRALLALDPGAAAVQFRKPPYQRQAQSGPASLPVVTIVDLAE